jgi:DNA-binding NarL/FixJ family response regulator
MKPKTFLLTDDHEAMREGTRVLIEREAGWKVCGAARTGIQAVALAQKLRPNVAVVDVMMPELGGLEVTRRIRRMLPQTEVLIFTAHESEELIQPVFEAGAKGYILKLDSGKNLVTALRCLPEHKPFFTSKVSDVLFARYLEGASSTKSDPLSSRENQTVQLLAEGKSNKQVAALLGVSIKTTETHRAAIMRKLSLHSFSELVRYAIRQKMIEA